MYEGSELSAPVDFRSEMVAILPRLRRFGLGLSGSMSTADQMAKDACEVAMGRANEFDAKDKFDSWMFSILHNVWQAKREERARNGGGDRSDDFIQNHTDFFGAQPETERPLLDQLVLALPDRQREVLMMVAIEGISYRDTAEVLDMPIGEVMQQASLARLALLTGIADAEGTS